MSISEDALDALKETSRTFFLPISHLPGGLQEAVMASYLCLRAIDEIEDHPRLDSHTKARLLRAISRTLQTSFQANDFAEVLENCWEELPEVTRRVGDWAMLAPISIAPRIWGTTARMAECMAQWAIDGWTIQNEVDLDRYAFEVAGAVGLLTSDLWVWYDGTLSNRPQAIGFGRGLQTVNILRNHAEDMARGVDFFPRGWQAEDM
ncbi:MAG: squalene/phytoene synthase family protein, partial [Ktedonobacteraceae bacterium]